MLPLLLIIVFLTLLFIIFGKIYFYVHIDTDKRVFELFFKVLKIKINIPVGKKRKTHDKGNKNGKPSDMLTYIRYLNINKLYVDITVGSGNAATDAITVGGLRIIFGMLYSLIQKNASSEAVHVKITPNFENTALNAKIESIISFKIRNIISQTIKNMRRN